MNLRKMGLAAWMVSTSAHAQVGILYELKPASELTAERCLPPCACPAGAGTGAMSGTFVLTKIAENPLFTDYSISDGRFLAALPLPFVPTEVRAAGIYRIGGEVSLTQRLDLNVVVLESPISDPFPASSGYVSIDPQNPFPAIGISVPTDIVTCFRYTLKIVAAPARCQADCDASGSLNALDFGCFLNRFAAGSPYANCDGSTAPPALNALDFSCYLSQFASGCS